MHVSKYLWDVMIYSFLYKMNNIYCGTYDISIFHRLCRWVAREQRHYCSLMSFMRSKFHSFNSNSVLATFYFSATQECSATIDPTVFFFLWLVQSRLLFCDDSAPMKKPYNFSAICNSAYCAHFKILYIPMFYNFMHNILISVISALNV